MVVFIFIYTFLNSIVSAAGFQNVYRIEVAGVPLGIMEAMLAMGVIFAMFAGGKKGSDPVDRMHPVYAICLVCLVIGQLAGMIGMFFNDAPLRFKLVFSREFFGMIAAVYTGYRLLPSFRAAAKVPYAFVFAGIGTSIFLMIAFARGSERYELHGDTNALRTVQFITNYAGVACGCCCIRCCPACDCSRHRSRWRSRGSVSSDSSRRCIAATGFRRWRRSPRFRWACGRGNASSKASD